MHPSHILQCTTQNRNVHFSVLNDGILWKYRTAALWDLLDWPICPARQYCQLAFCYWPYCVSFIKKRNNNLVKSVNMANVTESTSLKSIWCGPVELEFIRILFHNKIKVQNNFNTLKTRSIFFSIYQNMIGDPSKVRIIALWRASFNHYSDNTLYWWHIIITNLFIPCIYNFNWFIKSFHINSFIDKLMKGHTHRDSKLFVDPICKPPIIYCHLIIVETKSNCSIPN